MRNDDWHDEPVSMDRRTFLMLLAGAAAAQPLDLLADRRSTLETPDVTEDPWRTLDAVFEHMFPAEPDSPGSRDIRAIPYLQNMLAAPDMDPDDRTFVRDGVGWLNDLAREHHARDFVALDASARERMLRQVERSGAGERWLSMLLDYLLEALLADPVYGGNPDEIGWRWLEHQAGYPLPPAGKRYFKLGKPVHRRTKA